MNLFIGIFFLVFRKCLSESEVTKERDKSKSFCFNKLTLWVDSCPMFITIKHYFEENVIQGDIYNIHAR